MTTAIPPVTHTYKLTRWDLLRAQMHASVRNPVLTIFFIIMGTLIAWTTVREPEMAARPLALKIFVVLLLDVFFVIGIWTATMLVTWLFILLRKNRGVLGEHTLEVSSFGLVERTEYNETMHRWTGFHKTVRTRNYLYLWVTDSIMHVVPIRSFPSEEAAQYFQSEIETQKIRSGEAK